jgi:hypothetical protein
MKPVHIIFGGITLVILFVLFIVFPSGDNQLIALPQAMASGVSSPSVQSPLPAASASPGYKHKIQLGVYYFPGWRDRTPGAPFDYPWDPIKKFPDREPQLGWYQEGDSDVMAAHLDTMARNGLSYISFDWYWGADNRVYLGHALQTYLSLKDKRGLQFSLLWANHDEAPVSMSNFDRMVDYWVRHYFTSPSYLKVEGKPLVTVFSAEQLTRQASKMGATPAQLLDRANKRAQEEGLPGIYFVAGGTSDEPGFKSFSLRDSGYNAVSAYNLHWWPGKPHPAHSYDELDNAYRSHWARYRSIGQLPVVVPMSSGWDKRPWGGSDDPLHDQLIGTPEEFESHVRAGVQEVIKGGPPYIGVICCWNEFGEGSYVEPTRKLGDAIINKVGKVLKESGGS